jgi:hypothetical protein
MKKNGFLILILTLIGLSNSSFAQEPLLQKYIIVTFEDIYKRSGEGTQRHYWIIPQDSIKSDNNLLYHLFLHGFSRNNVNDCCSGMAVDPGSQFPNTSYDFEDAYIKSLDELDQIIANNRKKVQTITKTWSFDQREDIAVFATPVLGKFCSSNFSKWGQRKWAYKGKVYIPFSSFSYSEEFWKSDKAKFLLHEDFSKINFKVIPY